MTSWRLRRVETERKSLPAVAQGTRAQTTTQPPTLHRHSSSSPSRSMETSRLLYQPPASNGSVAKRRKLNTHPVCHLSTRATIHDVPEELLDRIARYLNNIGPKIWRNDLPGLVKKTWRHRHLHPLSLVSKKFHRITTPLLYSIFVNDDHPTALHQFLTTIMTNPTLAAHLRTVVIGDIQKRELFDDCPAPTRANILALVENMNFGCRQEEHDMWLAQMREGLLEAYFAFLLTQAPNLELLELETGELGIDEQYFSVFALFRAAFPRRDADPVLPLFSKLHHIILSDVNRDLRNFSSAKIKTPQGHSFEEVFSLPSLRTLELHEIYEPFFLMPNLSPHNASIQTLVTRTNTHPPRFLRNLVRACKEIKFLTYQFGRGSEDKGLIDVEAIRDTMLLHRHVLEALVLETVSPDLSLPYVSAISTLKPFTKLRHLAISGVLLFSNFEPGREQPPPDSLPGLQISGESPIKDFFPPCLQTLCIDLYSNPPYRSTDVLGIISSLAERGNGVLPDLRHVQLTVPPEMWDRGEKSKEWQENLGTTAALLMVSGMEQFTVRVFSVRRYPRAEQNRAYSARRDLFDKDKFRETGKFEWHHCFPDAHGALPDFL